MPITESTEHNSEQGGETEEKSEKEPEQKETTHQLAVFPAKLLLFTLKFITMNLISSGHYQCCFYQILSIFHQISKLCIRMWKERQLCFNTILKGVKRCFSIFRKLKGAEKTTKVMKVYKLFRK